MNKNMANLLKLAAAFGVSLAIYAGNALASDDVAALVVDNGQSVPEPATWMLVMGGAIAAGIAARRKKKDK